LCDGELHVLIFWCDVNPLFNNNRALQAPTDLDPSHREWRLIPPQAKRTSSYSPIMMSYRAVATLGLSACSSSSSGDGGGGDGGGGGCIPLYRTKYMYIHRIVTKAWLGAGVVCVGLMGDGMLSGPMLVNAKIASGTDEAAAKRYGFGPCLKIPTLEQSWRLTTKLLDSFTASEQKTMREEVGRRR
jgi:hypothetical protein